MSILRAISSHKNLLPLLLGPAFFIGLLCTLNSSGFAVKESVVLSGVLWMVTWWVSGIIPLQVTALLPLVIFPLSGIATIKEAAAQYAHPLVFLFLGGFILAAAMEKCNLHRRIALTIIKWLGDSPARIVAGFMISTAFLSMWISNTATTVMMLPIGLSVLAVLPEEGRNKESKHRLALSLMLGIAYAANIGGTATLIGTPPNALLAAFMQETYNVTIGFASWFMVGFPFAIIMLFITWFILTYVLYPTRHASSGAFRSTIDVELNKLGHISHAEKIVSTVFALTAACWMGRGLINSAITQYSLPMGKVSDSSIAIAASILLFFIPQNIKKKEFIMDWPAAHKIPWGILLLFGGGLTMASMLGKTNIVHSIGDIISSWNVATALLIAAIIVLTLFLTELMSNMALTIMLLPIVGGIALSVGVSPILFTAPLALAASCAFMMPVSTPPNAIVFASGHITVPQMMKSGIILNIIAIILLVFLSHTLILHVFKGM